MRDEDAVKEGRHHELIESKDEKVHTIATLVQTLVTAGDCNSAIGSKVPSLSRKTGV
jgi:hypothetical protein